MTRYTYTSERFDDAPGKLAVPGYDTIEIDDDGTFTVPADADDAVHERIREQGHEPLPETKGDDGSGDEPDDAETDPLDGLTEDIVANMDPQEVRSLASDHPDLDGRKSAGELEEEIILRLRGEEE